MEIFKDIVGYEGLYQVSNLGRVKSLNYGRTGEERILKQIDNKGYLRVNLSKDGNRKHFSVHRLVAATFLENPNNYPCINHKSEIKTDNRVENLEYCTYQYNNSYGTKPQRISESLKGRERSEEHKKNLSESLKGKKQSNERIEKCAKARQKWVIGINNTNGNILIFQSIKQASKELGISNSHISECCRGKSKSSGGYTWNYY